MHTTHTHTHTHTRTHTHVSRDNVIRVSFTQFIQYACKVSRTLTHTTHTHTTHTLTHSHTHTHTHTNSHTHTHTTVFTNLALSLSLSLSLSPSLSPQICDPSGATILHSLVPTSQVHILERCGHAISLERPRKCARLLAGFISHHHGSDSCHMTRSVSRIQGRGVSKIAVTRCMRVCYYAHA